VGVAKVPRASATTKILRGPPGPRAVAKIWPANRPEMACRQRAQRSKVHRVAAQVDVAHEQHRRANAERHVGPSDAISCCAHPCAVSLKFTICSFGARVVLDREVDAAAAGFAADRGRPNSRLERNRSLGTAMSYRTGAPSPPDLPCPRPVDAGSANTRHLNQRESPSFRAIGHDVPEFERRLEFVGGQRRA
jgi:hypothetical protein